MYSGAEREEEKNPPPPLALKQDVPPHSLFPPFLQRGSLLCRGPPQDP